MPFAYPYVGPPEVLRASQGAPAGRVITSARDLATWIDEREADEGATFVVGLDGRLRLAPRRSEHVACAGSLEVLAAGELQFVHGLRVTSVSNQSTGFCPAVECWPEVVAALSFSGVVLPPAFTHAIEFRRCPDCAEVNLVKEAWFVCVFCDADLPHVWNVSARRRIEELQT